MYRHVRDTSSGGVAIYGKDTLSYHNREGIYDANSGMGIEA